MFGALLNARLAVEGASRLPSGLGVKIEHLAQSPKGIRALPAGLQHSVIDALSASIDIAGCSMYICCAGSTIFPELVAASCSMCAS